MKSLKEKCEDEQKKWDLNTEESIKALTEREDTLLKMEGAQSLARRRVEQHPKAKERANAEEQG